MATIAEFTVPADEFPLGTIFAERPNVTVELDRLIPTNHAILPYFWVYGAELDDVEAEFSSHPGVTTITLVDSVDGEYLLRVEWASDYHGILTVLAETQTALVSVVGTNTEWTFEIRGDDREDVSELMTIFRNHDISAELRTVHDLNSVTETDYQLTDAQREAVLLAHERGYFESPREVKMEMLADELDITRQAFAERLRRGLDHLVANTLAQDDDRTGS